LATRCSMVSVMKAIEKNSPSRSPPAAAESR
jgi:hypothetical protein